MCDGYVLFPEALKLVNSFGIGCASALAIVLSIGVILIERICNSGLHYSVIRYLQSESRYAAFWKFLASGGVGY